MDTTNFPDMKMDVYLGSAAFALWTTYGLPFEIFQDMCRGRGLRASKIVFDCLMDWHRDRSRAWNLL